LSRCACYRRYLERFVTADLASAFDKKLLEHHRKVRGADSVPACRSLEPVGGCQIRSDGMLVLEYAVIEHNIVAASRLYDNITFAALGRLVGVPADKVEGIAAKMIAEKRIGGVIDQVNDSLDFSTST
jgi:hypothetical protein